jgi:3-dehydroquinate dehydratase-2
MTRVLVLHGPNLNMLGRREPTVYGTTTLAEIDQSLVALAAELGISVDCRQSNHEGVLIDWIQQARDEGFRAILVNPGGLSHTSVSLRDALALTDLPIAEVHLTNTQAREEFRHHSYVSAIARGVLMGFGPEGYRLGLRAIASWLSA